MTTVPKRAQDTLVGKAGMNVLFAGMPFIVFGCMLLGVFHGTSIEAKIQTLGIVLVSIAGAFLFVGVILSVAAEIWVRE